MAARVALAGVVLGSVVLGGPRAGSAQAPPVQPAKEATLVVSEFVNDRATFSLPRPGAWRRSFVVYATSGSVPIADVTIRVTSFQGAGAAVEPTSATPKLVALDGKSTVIDPSSLGMFAVEAVFGAEDTYVSTLVLSAPGIAPLIRTIIVQLAAPSPATAVIALTQIGPKEFSASDSKEVIQLSVVNSSDVDQTVEVHPGPRFMRKAAGEPEVDAGVVLSAPPTITVPKRGVGTIEVTVDELDAAGQYSGEVRLASPGAAPVVLTTRIFVRSSVWCAILLIAGGVVAAWGISWFREIFRQRQELRINLGRLHERLGQSLAQLASSRARAAWQRLDREAGQIDEAISLGKATKETIEGYGARVVLFQDANHAESLVAELSSVTVQVDKRKLLDEVFDVAGQEGATTTAIAEARKKLEQVDASNLKRLEIAGGLDVLEASLAEDQEAADQAFKDAVKSRVAPHLADARRHQRIDDLPEAQRALDRAREALAAIGVSEMAEVVKQRPAWAHPEAWKAWAAKLEPMLEAPVSMETYRELREAFLSGLVEQTLRGAELAEVDAAELLQVKAGSDRRATLRAMRVLQDRLVASMQRAANPMLPEDAQYTSASSSTVTVAAVPEVTALGERSPSSPPAWRSLHRGLLLKEGGVTLATGVLAVLAGLLALWFADAGWGSCRDMISAFLWGAGVKVTVDALVGVSALRGSIDKA